MSAKEKRRVRAGAIVVSNRHEIDHSAIHSRIKALIVRLAVWGLLPAGLAGWIIRRGGMRDA